MGLKTLLSRSVEEMRLEVVVVAIFCAQFSLRLSGTRQATAPTSTC